MTFRKAASVALMGWYFMVPPTPQAFQSNDPRAISNWEVEARLDTEAGCRTMLAERIKQARDNGSAALSAEAKHALCVPTDDPRVSSILDWVLMVPPFNPMIANQLVLNAPKETRWYKVLFFDTEASCLEAKDKTDNFQVAYARQLAVCEKSVQNAEQRWEYKVRNGLVPHDPLERRIQPFGFCIGGTGLFPKQKYVVHDRLIDPVPATVTPLGCYLSFIECESVRQTLNSASEPNRADTAQCVGIGG